MKIYLFKNFNNYYNRIIQKYDSINDYTSKYEYAVRGYNNELKTLESGSNFNFNINDGIYSNITYNYDPNQEWQPDYLIVTENDDSIKYRYYVLNAVRTRKGQYKLTLKRDVIADTYDYTIKSPIYFERAMLSKNNPLIFKNENNSYNQIKNDEYLLKDKSKCAWIVGYITTENSYKTTTTTNGSSSTVTTALPTEVTSKYNMDYDIYWEGEFKTYIENLGFETNDFESYSYHIFDINKFELDYSAQGQNISTIKNTYHIVGDTASVTTSLFGGSKCRYKECDTEYNTKVSLLQSISENKVYDKLYEYLSSEILHLKRDVSVLKNLNNKIIKCKVGNEYKYYKMTFNNTTNSESLLYWYAYHNNSATIDFQQFDTSALTDEMKTLYNQLKETIFKVAKDEFTYSSSSNGDQLYIDLTIKDKLDCYSLVHKLITVEDAYKVPICENRVNLVNQPYSMFCIPYPTDTDIYINTNQSVKYKVNPEASMNIAMAISGQLAEGCYDIQLLPYCPIQGLINDSGDDIVLDIKTYYGIDDKLGKYDYIKDTTSSPKIQSVLIWCSQSEFTFNIDKYLAVKDDDIEFKVQDETEFYRLNSPNYNGSYEFKATRNNGVDYFNIDCSYKPYTPYIHINPNFKHLYGNDFNDSNGLICSGNFSLTQITDQWMSYIINNKTYQSQFDRQIQNMDVNNKIANDQAIASIITGAVQGASTGGFIGNSLGGKGGALIGGAVSGVASAVGGYYDLQYQKQLQQESKSYATDVFNLNNQAIQARPNTLSKVDSFNFNNKIYPFLERYDCTDKEKEILKDQLKYNSMSVNLISTISDMQHEDKTFMKGKLIKYISNTSHDNYFISDLAEELNKGVYI